MSPVFFKKQKWKHYILNSLLIMKHFHFNLLFILYYIALANYQITTTNNNICEVQRLCN